MWLRVSADHLLLSWRIQTGAEELGFVGFSRSGGWPPKRPVRPASRRGVEISAALTGIMLPCRKG